MGFSDAGGTQGGTGRFFIGLAMIVAGGYLFLNAIHITHHFGLGAGLFGFGRVRITTGMVLIPFIFGIGMVFYNAKSTFGWILTAASLLMLSVGVLTSINFSMQGMSAFDLLMILVLLVGGIGMFLSSLKQTESLF